MTARAEPRLPQPARRRALDLPEALVAEAATLPPGAWPGLRIMPIAGTRVAQPAGDRLRAHGLLLESWVPQTVSAPAGGRVVFAAPFRQLGLLLIIEHEQGYHSLLAGLSRLDVVEGASVVAGQSVGSLDANGRPSRLYLEVRQHGSPLDPALWFASREDKVRG